MICSQLETIAEGGNDNGDFKDNLRNAGNTGESQYPDEFEVHFTDRRKTIPGRDKQGRIGTYNFVVPGLSEPLF